MSLYSTEVTARGGRTGRAISTDSRLDVALSMPKELGGDGGAGTNPEQLFAAGYAACFDSAVRLVARKQRLELGEDSQVTAKVALIRNEAGLFELRVALTGSFPTLTSGSAAVLMDMAHKVCPYSNATRGNIQVELHVAPNDSVQAAPPAAHTLSA